MTDATDDLELAEYFGTSTPVRDMDGAFYVYWHQGKKYSFRSVAEANKWAKKKGFRLSTNPPRQNQKGYQDE